MILTATKQETEPFRIERLKQFYEVYKQIASPILNIDFFIEGMHDHKGCVIIKWFYKVPGGVKLLAGIAWESVGESKDQVEHEHPYNLR